MFGIMKVTASNQADRHAEPDGDADNDDSGDANKHRRVGHNHHHDHLLDDNRRDIQPDVDLIVHLVISNVHNNHDHHHRRRLRPCAPNLWLQHSNLLSNGLLRLLRRLRRRMLSDRARLPSHVVSDHRLHDHHLKRRHHCRARERCHGHGYDGRNVCQWVVHLSGQRGANGRVLSHGVQLWHSELFSGDGQCDGFGGQGVAGECCRQEGARLGVADYDTLPFGSCVWRGLCLGLRKPFSEENETKQEERRATEKGRMGKTEQKGRMSRRREGVFRKEIDRKDQRGSTISSTSNEEMQIEFKHAYDELDQDNAVFTREFTKEIKSNQPPSPAINTTTATTMLHRSKSISMQKKKKKKKNKEDRP